MREFVYGLLVMKFIMSWVIVLFILIMEIRRVFWVLLSLRFFVRFGKKLNGMKNFEIEVNRYIYVVCICGIIFVKENINILMLLIWRYEISNGYNRIIVFFKSFFLIFCFNLFFFLKLLVLYDEIIDYI